MPKRTTLVPDDKVYERLVKESLKRYGTARSLSKVVNQIVEGTEQKGDIMSLIYSEKIAKTSALEFEQFRRGLSKRLEH
jgi:predicted CopG family antitoxin